MLRGAVEILSRSHPALFVEVDEIALESMRSSVENILELLAPFAYDAHQLKRGKIRPLPDYRHIRDCLRHGSTDILFC